MSIFSQTVREHWTKYRPRELAAMQDPAAFFLMKGREIEVAILAEQEALEQTVPVAENYHERAGQLRQIRADATAKVLRELLPEPEPGTEPGTEQVPELDPVTREILEIQQAMYDL